MQLRHLSYLLMTAALCLCLAVNWLSVLRVEGVSMYPTIDSGDLLILLRWPIAPGHGSFVVVTDPENRHPARPRLMVKRVIGLAGDTIRLDGNGQVWRNGTKLTEPYRTGLTWTEHATKEHKPKTILVPKDHVYLLGDNRPVSRDSRAYGTLPVARIYARLLTVVD